MREKEKRLQRKTQEKDGGINRRKRKKVILRKGI